MGWLNIASLLLGLVAWFLPIIYLLRKNKTNWGQFAVVSMLACAIALICQIRYTQYLVAIEDFSALMDTAQAVTVSAITLLSITVLLNIFTFTRTKRHTII